MDFISFTPIYNLILILGHVTILWKTASKKQGHTFSVPRMISVSLVLMKVQPMPGTSKLGFQFSATTNMIKGKKVSIAYRKD